MVARYRARAPAALQQRKVATAHVWHVAKRGAQARVSLPVSSFWLPGSMLCRPPPARRRLHGDGQNRVAGKQYSVLAVSIWPRVFANFA